MKSKWSPESRTKGKRGGQSRNRTQYTHYKGENNSPLFEGLKLAAPEPTLESEASHGLESDSSGCNQYLECEATQNGELLSGQKTEQLNYSQGTAENLIPSRVEEPMEEDEIEMRINESNNTGVGQRASIQKQYKVIVKAQAYKKPPGLQ